MSAVDKAARALEERSAALVAARAALDAANPDDAPAWDAADVAVRRAAAAVDRAKAGLEQAHKEADAARLVAMRAELAACVQAAERAHLFASCESLVKQLGRADHELAAGADTASPKELGAAYERRIVALRAIRAEVDKQQTNAARARELVAALGAIRVEADRQRTSAARELVAVGDTVHVDLVPLEHMLVAARIEQVACDPGDVESVAAFMCALVGQTSPMDTPCPPTGRHRSVPMVLDWARRAMVLGDHRTATREIAARAA